MSQDARRWSGVKGIRVGGGENKKEKREVQRYLYRFSFITPRLQFLYSPYFSSFSLFFQHTNSLLEETIKCLKEHKQKKGATSGCVCFGPYSHAAFFTSFVAKVGFNTWHSLRCWLLLCMHTLPSYERVTSCPYMLSMHFPPSLTQQTHWPNCELKIKNERKHPGGCAKNWVDPGGKPGPRAQGPWPRLNNSLPWTGRPPNSVFWIQKSTPSIRKKGEHSKSSRYQNNYFPVIKRSSSVDTLGKDLIEMPSHRCSISSSLQEKRKQKETEFLPTPFVALFFYPDRPWLS